MYDLDTGDRIRLWCVLFLRGNSGILSKVTKALWLSISRMEGGKRFFTEDTLEPLHMITDVALGLLPHEASCEQRWDALVNIDGPEQLGPAKHLSVSACLNEGGRKLR